MSAFLFGEEHSVCNQVVKAVGFVRSEIAAMLELGGFLDEVVFCYIGGKGLYIFGYVGWLVPSDGASGGGA